jgi:hypothetical protein
VRERKRKLFPGGCGHEACGVCGLCKEAFELLALHDEAVRVMHGVVSSPGYVDLAQSDRAAVRAFLAKAGGQVSDCFAGGAATVVDLHAECSGLFDTCRRHNVPLTSCADPAQIAKAVVDEAVSRGVAEGRRLATAAIVADLRRKADIVSAMSTRDAHAVSVARALRETADRYESGEHEEKT